MHFISCIATLNIKIYHIIIIFLLILFNLNHINGSEVTKSGNNSSEPQKNSNVQEAIEFIKWHNRAASKICHKSTKASWNFETDMNPINQKKMVRARDAFGAFFKEAWKNVTFFDWKKFSDPIRRWFMENSVLGTGALPPQKDKMLGQTQFKMAQNYQQTRFCDFINRTKCDLPFIPTINNVMALLTYTPESRLHYWTDYRDRIGILNRELFIDYVKLSNEAAKLNGFSDKGEMWRSYYEADNFEKDVERLWEQIKPLYSQLHAYVRKKLIKQYPDYILPDGPLPAHLLGSMWSQSWKALDSILRPFPDRQVFDATPNMIKYNVTVLEMYQIADDFFRSLGMKPVPDTFWKVSMLEQPPNKEVECMGTAWDFCNGKDFRIKMCTGISQDFLITVHHEMGHIQYMMQYKDLPYTFRTGANEGWHEAIGDTIGLSVSTPSYLKHIGLLDSDEENAEADINFLLSMALEKIAFIPSAYIFDLWRWRMFRNETNKMNEEWWKLRRDYQGVCSTNRRTEKTLDPTAKYHVVNDIPYIRYYVSYIIQFQFHKALCEAAEYKGPLHKCSVYGNKKAGKKFSKALRLGLAKPWQETMKIFTGISRMDATPVLEYFEPLYTWLKEQNKDEFIGWKSLDPMECPQKPLNTTQQNVENKKN